MTSNLLDQMEKMCMGSLEHLTKPLKSFLKYDILYNEKEHEITFNMAVAGYTHDDLEVTFENGLLEVSASKVPAEYEDMFVLWKGLSNKAFVTKIPVGTLYEVEGVTLVDGILSVKFKRNDKVAEQLEIR